MYNSMIALDVVKKVCFQLFVCSCDVTGSKHRHSSKSVCVCAHVIEMSYIMLSGAVCCLKVAQKCGVEFVLGIRK